MKKHSIVLVLALLFICNTAFFCTFSANAQTLAEPDLLLITDDETVLKSFSENPEDHIALIESSRLTEKQRPHLAYAVSKELLQNTSIREILIEAYQNYNSRVYIYGGLTIKNYCDILDLDSFSISMNIYNAEGRYSATSQMKFSAAEEENKIFQVIAHSKDSRFQSLTVGGANNLQSDMIDLIIEHYQDTFFNPYQRNAVIVKSAYAHKVPTTMIGSLYLNVDYILYQDQDEKDDLYDYFILKTNVTGVGNGNLSKLEVKHELTDSRDHVTDYGPKDVNRATSVNVGVSYGPTASANLSFSFAVGAGPTIDSNYDASSGTVSWKVKKYWFFGKPFTGDMMSFATSWASRGKSVIIKFSTYGLFNVVNNYAYDTPWDSQTLNFAY